MSQAVAGHGALIAIELDPTGAPGSFTTVAELNGDISWPELNRPETEVTTHQDDIDQWILGRLGRGALTFSVNFIFDDTTHDHLTGLQQKIIDNEIFGVRMRGPGGTTDTDEWISSGQVQAIKQVSPVREGARTADVTIRLSKRQKVDGVFVGSNT
jgi:hypothetical protein